MRGMFTVFDALIIAGFGLYLSDPETGLLPKWQARAHRIRSAFSPTQLLGSTTNGGVQ